MFTLDGFQLYEATTVSRSSSHSPRSTIVPKKPLQNGFCESFNSLMRYELLNENLFFGLVHARTEIAGWADNYSSQRLHLSLGYLTP